MTSKRSFLPLAYGLGYLFLVKLSELVPGLPFWFQVHVYPFLALVALLFFIRDWQADWEKAKALKWRFLSHLGLGFLAQFALGTVASLLSSLLLEGLGASDYVLQNDQNIGQALREIPYVWVFLAGAICGPLVEEVSFRYLLFGSLRKRLSLPVAMTTQALLFGLIHIHTWSWAEVVSILPHAASGLVFAYLYHREDSIYLPIALHMLWNTLGFLGLGATG